MSKFIPALALVSAILLLAGPATAQTNDEYPTRQWNSRLSTGEDYGAFPSDHESIVRERPDLVDPESQRLRELSPPVPADWRDRSSGLGYQVCTTFNARNSMGGYVGWKTVYLLIRDGEVRDWVGIGDQLGCPAVSNPQRITAPAH